MSTGAKSGGSWNFQLNPDGWWTWSHRDVQGAEMAASDQPFRYFHDAIADARRHGFRGDDQSGKKNLGCFF